MCRCCPIISRVNFEDAALKGSDVLIEFTTPEATIAHLKVLPEIWR